MNDFLISIRPQHVTSIAAGEKSVEIRNRRVNIPAGARLWIYTTLPVGCVATVATVSAVETGPPKIIWQTFAPNIAITWTEYKRYVNGAQMVSAIHLADARQIHPPITLEELRTIKHRFGPPQYLKRLQGDSGILRLFESRTASPQ